MKNLTTILLILTVALSQAQEKVKGNREPSTVITALEPFTIIEIGGDYEVSIVEGAAPQIEITTDSNLHEFIVPSVVDGRVSINTTANIRSKKEMTIRLIYPAGLTKIIAKEKAEISAVTEIQMAQLEIEALDDAKLFLTTNIEDIKVYLKDNSKAELNLRGNTAKIDLTDKASIKALLKFQDLNLVMKNRTDVQLEGDIKTGSLLLEHKASFKGENLLFTNLDVKASGNTECEVNVSADLTLAASDESKTKVSNTPKIQLDRFSGTSQLIKQ